MPAGIPKRLTDELGKLGITLEPYRSDKNGLPSLTGIEVGHRGRILGVAEQEPRGWGGDNKWYVRRTRTPDDADPAPYHDIHGRQKDAIAAIIRAWM
jgi:hypothetical protein